MGSTRIRTLLDETSTKWVGTWAERVKGALEGEERAFEMSQRKVVGPGHSASCGGEGRTN